ncbi:MAG: hypothetical protein V4662_02480 [Verrucomicrobiota bacterium]
MDSSISDNLAVAAAKAGGIELSADILEFSVDQVLDEGILKDIPFVGWIAKGFAIGLTISDRILYHKILRFLLALKSVENTERIEFRNKVDSDPSFRRKVGEHLVVMLDKMDAFDKSYLLAIAFDHFMTEDITHDHFVDLAHIIDRALLADLKTLGVPDNQRMAFSSTGLAASSGILEFGISEPEAGTDLPQLGTRISQYGRDLRDMFLGRFRTRAADQKAAKERMLNLLGRTPDSQQC